MQKIENQTINNISTPKEIEEIDIPEEDEEEPIDLDF